MTRRMMATSAHAVTTTIDVFRGRPTVRFTFFASQLGWFELP